MSELKEKTQTDRRSPRRHGRSVFGPIFLIALGFFLLFGNLGMLPELHWAALLQLWPLLLVFLGLNILVRAVPHPLGTILSALVALIAVGVVSYVLLFADEIPALAAYSSAGTGEMVREQVSFPAENVEAADVTIEFASPSVLVTTLSDSNELIEADVTHSGQLDFESSVSDGQATVVLKSRPSNEWYFWLNPANWDAFAEDVAWRVGLSPDVPMTLDFDMASGSAELNLVGLLIEHMVVDGGSGSVALVLPDGDYDLLYDVSAGHVDITLPEGGRHEFKLQGGSGSLTVIIPNSLEVRLELVDDGTGNLAIADRRLRQVEGDGVEEGAVWQTEDYEDNPNRVNILLEVGSGSVSVDNG